jgi:hypothetical protein
VLLLDAQDYYGGAWASVCGRAFERVLLGQEAAAARPSPADAASPSADAPDAVPLPSHALAPLRATGVTVWQAGEQARQQRNEQDDCRHALLLPPLLRACRALDLAPRALYQGEPLVDGLVAARAHPYVDFKLVEGSYVLDAAADEQAPPQAPLLLRIPASKAHIFADRSLAPREKRALMRFLAAGLEAAAAVAAAEEEQEDRQQTDARTASTAAAAQAAAQGAFPAAAARQKEASSLVAALARRDVSLASVLEHEGLPPRVRDFVLYGIAMESRVVAAGAAAAEAQAAAEHDDNATSSRQQLPPLLSAAEGRDALALYAASLGRFAAPEPTTAAPTTLSASLAPPPPPAASAFMAAAHGAGSLVEAFVRHAAVRGALTVLRRPVGALLLLEDESGQAKGQRRRVAGVKLASSSSGQQQRLSAPAVVGARASLLPVAGEGSKGAVLARCVAVLDGPLRPESGGGAAAAADALALLVAPPSGATSPGAAAAVVVRGLMLGPAAQVGPAPTAARPGPFYLLYLVADVTHLVGGGGAGGWAAAAAAAAATAAPSAESVLAPVLSQLAVRGGDESECRPRVLEAVFYTQWPVGSEAQGQEQGGSRAAAAAAADGQPPHDGLVVCPGPDEVAPGVAGYVHAWAAAEQLYRRHFPGLAWLGEEPQRRGEGGEEEEEEGAEARRAAEEEQAPASAAGGEASAQPANSARDARAGGDEASEDPGTEGMDAIEELSSALAALEELDAGGQGTRG